MKKEKWLRMKTTENMNFNRSFKIMKHNISREPWLTLGSIIVMSLTFLTLNFFIFVLAGSNLVLKYLEDKTQFSIFFADTASQEKILEYKNDIEKDGRVLNVRYVSKEDALNIFKEASKNQPALLESIESNPLPASLEVKAKEISNLQKMSEDFSKFEGVEEVIIYEDVINNFKKLSSTLRIISLVLLVILSIVSIITILLTIGVTIHSKGVEVEIMKLVGATDKYVKGPLTLQGMFYGVAAALASPIIVRSILILFSPVLKSVFGGIPVGNSWWEFLFWRAFSGEGASVTNMIISFLSLLGIEMLFGIILGYIGAALAIKKYLKY